MKFATLCYIIKDGRILLIKKKRGLGAGKWNGPGGKVEKGENIFECVSREVMEEIGVKPINLKLVGKNEFYFDEKKENNQTVFVFVANDFVGELKETDEAEPKWFDLDEIPFEEMWIDDRVWMPLMLEDKKFSGKFYFVNEEKMKNYEIKEVDEIGPVV